MAPVDYPNPLTPAHCDCLDRVITKTTEVMKLIQDCSDCGLDFSGALEEAKQQNDLAVKLKAKFFPNRT